MWLYGSCIGRSSSAELSEAINSMYAWYRSASICYAHLADVVSTTHQQSLGEDFWAASWWTRGWTLQELLAPFEVEFFSADWEPLGAKTELCERIAERTGIDAEYLSDSSNLGLPESLDSASIAKRMSWASARQTTRPEVLLIAC